MRRLSYFTQFVIPHLKPYSKYKMTDFEKEQIKSEWEEIPGFDLEQCQALCDIYHKVFKNSGRFAYSF